MHQGILTPEPTVEEEQLGKILAELARRPLTMDELELATSIRINVVTWRMARLRKEDRVHVSGFRRSERTGRLNMVFKPGRAPTSQLDLRGFW